MWEMPSSRQPPLLFHLAEAATGRSSDSGAGAFGSGLAEGASLQGGAYTLGAQIHRGPRSRVWRATSSASGSSVVIKVLDASTPERRRRALHEVEMLRHVKAADSTAQRQQQPGAAGSGPVSSSGSGSRDGQLLVQLQDWFYVGGASEGSAGSAASSSRGGASSSDSSSDSSNSRVGGASGGGSGSSTGACVALVLEPLHQSASNVLSYLGERRRRGLPAPAVRNLSRQLLGALAALHDTHGMVHRDVKPSNLLLAAPFFKGGSAGEGGGKGAGEGKAQRARAMSRSEISSAPWRLVDFGNAAPLVRVGLWGRPLAQEAAAYDTPPYAPPEAVLLLPASSSYDLWSAGCVIYEAATGSQLFDPQPGDGFTADEQHLWQIKQLLGQPPLRVLDRSPLAEQWYDARGLLLLEGEHALRPQPMEELLHNLWGMPEEQAEGFASFLSPMLQFDPEQRASAHQMLQHPWLAGDDDSGDATAQYSAGNSSRAASRGGGVV